MSSLHWRDWSCTVRIVLADGRALSEEPSQTMAEKVEGLVRDLMGQVAQSANRFDRNSDITRVNAEPGQHVVVRKLTVELVDLAIAAARRTQGACDPMLGRQVIAAGYDVDIDVVRSRGVSRSVEDKLSSDSSAVHVDRQLNRVGVPLGAALDLGATAKAWTADEAVRRLAQALDTPVLVAIGGDIATYGPGVRWPVLVSEHEAGPGEIVTIPQGGIATSSTRGRRWMTSAGERHHIIDPRTGEPVTGSIRTASVVASTCLDANTLSTAALVWGAESMKRLRDHPARFVEDTGRVVSTPLWSQESAA